MKAQSLALGKQHCHQRGGNPLKVEEQPFSSAIDPALR